MSSARLSTLLRQRQLLTEHLAWLDTEIAAASAPASPSLTPQPAPFVPVATSLPAPLSPVPVTPPAPSVVDPLALPAAPAPASPSDTSPDALALANARADALLAEYRAKSDATPDNTRRSCILLAVGLGLIGIALIMAIYLWTSRRYESGPERTRIEITNPTLATSHR